MDVLMIAKTANALHGIDSHVAMIWPDEPNSIQIVSKVDGQIDGIFQSDDCHVLYDAVVRAMRRIRYYLNNR